MLLHLRQQKFQSLIRVGISGDLNAHLFLQSGNDIKHLELRLKVDVFPQSFGVLRHVLQQA